MMFKLISNMFRKDNNEPTVWALEYDLAMANVNHPNQTTRHYTVKTTDAMTVHNTERVRIRKVPVYNVFKELEYFVSFYDITHPIFKDYNLNGVQLYKASEL